MSDLTDLIGKEKIAITWPHINDNFHKLAARSVPAGGTTGEMLVKNSNANYDTTWAPLTPPTPVSIVTAATLSSNQHGTTNATGDVLTLALTLSHAVHVTGSPTVPITFSGQPPVPQTMTYDAAHSTSTLLKFIYTIQSGDNLTSNLAPAWSPYTLYLEGDMVSFMADIPGAFPANYTLTTSVYITPAFPLNTLGLNNGGWVQYGIFYSLIQVGAVTGGVILDNTTGQVAVLTFTPPDTSAFTTNLSPTMLSGQMQILDLAGADVGLGNATTGLRITILAYFQSAVTVAGTPQIAANIGTSNNIVLNYDPVVTAASFTQSPGNYGMAFTYTVLSTDACAVGAFNCNGGISLNGGSIVDAVSGIPLPDWSYMPSLSSQITQFGVNATFALSYAGFWHIADILMPPANTLAFTGNQICLSVQYFGNTTLTVDTTGGTPYVNLFTLYAAQNPVQMSLISGAYPGSPFLVFGYVVQSTDIAMPGNVGMDTVINLNGATITDSALGGPANLSLPYPGPSIPGWTIN